VNDEAVKWLREQIGARLELAREAGREDDTSWRFDYQGRPVARIVGAPWESSYGDGTWNCDDPEDGCDELSRAGTLTGEHIALNDPQDVIARCEAELAILDEHGPTNWTSYGDTLCRRCRWEEGELERDLENDTNWVVFPCRTVRLLASGYKHREGYAQHWGDVNRPA
jgi:hypothetical protein